MKNYLFLLSFFVLSACGFHLKGEGGGLPPLPYHTWQITNAGAMQRPLTQALYRQNHILIKNTPNSATLNICGINQDKTIQSINRYGLAQEYLLSLQVCFEVFSHGQRVGKPMTVTIERTLNDSDNLILGKQQEEQQVWQMMREEASKQIVIRLGFLPTEHDIQVASP